MIVHKLSNILSTLLYKNTFVASKEILEFLDLLHLKGLLTCVYNPYTKQIDIFNIKFNNIRQISKPGRRIFRSYKDILQNNQGLGEVIIRTSQGIISLNDARERKLGGEVICSIK